MTVKQPVKMANLTWGYGEDNGPSHWGDVAPDSRGRHQSPIDIIPSEAEFDRRLSERPLAVHYTDHQCHHMQNNGHSVQVTLDEDTAVDRQHQSSIGGGPMDAVHLLKQFHFHWGAKSTCGSEHKVAGKVYSAELHLVHWNSASYSSFEEAAAKPDGLVVLAVFIQAGEEHKTLNDLTRLFDRIQFSEDHVTIPDGFDPSSLLPADLSKYWTYCGSLTTPPCHESVRFIVFKDPIEVSEDQLNAFRGLRPRPFTRQVASAKTTCCRLVNNFRPTMPLNGRSVQASFRKFFA